MSALWVPCSEGCGEFWCNLHEMHAFECPCPPVEEHEHDPYTDHEATMPVAAKQRTPRASTRPLTPAALRDLDMIRGTQTNMEFCGMLRLSEFTVRAAMAGKPLGKTTLRYLEENVIPRLRKEKEEKP